MNCLKNKIPLFQFSVLFITTYVVIILLTYSTSLFTYFFQQLFTNLIFLSALDLQKVELSTCLHLQMCSARHHIREHMRAHLCCLCNLVCRLERERAWVLATQHLSLFKNLIQFTRATNLMNNIKGAVIISLFPSSSAVTKHILGTVDLLLRATLSWITSMCVGADTR